MINIIKRASAGRSREHARRSSMPVINELNNKTCTYKIVQKP